MKIRKKSGTAILNGNVIDSLEGNSTTNAPSQRAVAEAIGEKVAITNGEGVKTGITIDGKAEYCKYIQFTFGPSINTWYEIGQIPAGSNLISFNAWIQKDGGIYPIPFSYPHPTTGVTQAITIYFDTANGKLFAMFNYDYVGNGVGKVKIYYAI